MEATADVIVWMIRNWELVLGIFLFLALIGALMHAHKKAELRSWSDEKLEARQTYLLYHNRNRLQDDEYWMIHEELERRVHNRCKQSAAEEWSKFS